MEDSRKIDLAIECAVAASRWRIAARFEGPETAAQFRALAARRSKAATSLLSKLGKGALSEDRAPPITTKVRGGADEPRSRYG